jgi:hypothetical protein
MRLLCESRSPGIVVLTTILFVFLGSWGPVPSGMRGVHSKNQPSLQPIPEKDNFRCIVLGDSQTTDTSAERIRTQSHRWDAPIIGELVCAGSSSTGFLVNNGTFGVQNLLYRNVDLDGGWLDNGPRDFFAQFASEWEFTEDVTAVGARIGRYRLRFGPGNSDAPWREPWGIGNNLVARIAVRTSAHSIRQFETRAERGGVVDFSTRRLHTLDNFWGVQILEQPIPAGFNPAGDDVGIGIYIPAGQVEEPGQVLQVLGVVIERVGPKGEQIPGMILTYQGRGGWSILDHLNGVSQASRQALAEATRANTILFALGHNPEGSDLTLIETRARLLIERWEQAFAAAGLDRPSLIYLSPWFIDTGFIEVYLRVVESTYHKLANERRSDFVVSYQRLFDELQPDDYDPLRYQMDFFGTHPGNVQSAVNLSQDLYEMIFEGRRD